MRGDIQKKWLKRTDDLVTQVQTKYMLDKAQAQRDVDAFAT
jgi:hypothetical protein